MLFGEIITNPTAAKSVEDLQLLHQTVLYFLEFQKYHISALKLERVAETSTRIAEAYVRHIFSQQHKSPPDGDLEKIETISSGATLGAGGNIPAQEPLPAFDYQGPMDARQPKPGSITIAENAETGPTSPQLPVDQDCSLDPNSLLNLFSYPVSLTARDPQREQGTTYDQPNTLLQGPRLQVDDPINRSCGPYVSLKDVDMNGISLKLYLRLVHLRNLQHVVGQHSRLACISNSDGPCYHDGGCTRIKKAATQFRRRLSKRQANPTLVSWENQGKVVLNLGTAHSASQQNLLFKDTCFRGKRVQDRGH